MTRIGINPARHKLSDYRPARVTVAVITHIPQLRGYFRKKLEVLCISLSSLLAHTSLPYDLLVFDNNSCSEVVDYLRGLRDKGAVRFLLLAGENVGKIGALRIIFEAVPSDIVAYSDEDILFYPGWLEAHLRILEAYPNAGMVSGVPVRNASCYATQTHQRLLAQCDDEVQITRQRRIPDEWEIDWALSTGRDPQEHLIAMQAQTELVLCRKGVEAIGAANHFQFVAPKHVILNALPQAWSGRLMGQMVELDEAVDAAGYLRLSTVERYTRHIGNVVSPELLEEARKMELPTKLVTGIRVTRRRHWLVRIPGLRRLLLALYDRMFDLLYEINP
jgi:glycosyltransferase involved in cell wall biosynthesis